jgi:hypothetical protein
MHGHYVSFFLKSFTSDFLVESTFLIQILTSMSVNLLKHFQKCFSVGFDDLAYHKRILGMS